MASPQSSTFFDYQKRCKEQTHEINSLRFELGYLRKTLCTCQTDPKRFKDEIEKNRLQSELEKLNAENNNLKCQLLGSESLLKNLNHLKEQNADLLSERNNLLNQVMDLETNWEEQRIHFLKEIADLKNEIDKGECEKLLKDNQGLLERIGVLQMEIDELRESNTKTEKNNKAEIEERDNNDESSSTADKDNDSDISRKVLVKAIQKLMIETKKQKKELTITKKKNKDYEEQIEKFRTEMANDDKQMEELLGKEGIKRNDNIKTKEELIKELKEKSEIIEQLNKEIKKRTYNLQELVNKELWDKNREIEKLNKLCDRKKEEIALLKKQLCYDKQISTFHKDHNLTLTIMREIQPTMNLRNDKENRQLSTTDDVKLLKEQLRISMDDKRKLIQKITDLEKSDKSESCLINNLRMECMKRKEELDAAEKVKKDAYNACSMLTGRLMELAGFLEALLSRDCGISMKKKEILKQAIEKSKEISKSFSMDGNNLQIFDSMTDLSAPILPDYSEINLSFSGGDDYDDESCKNSIFNRIRNNYEKDYTTTESDLKSTYDEKEDTLKKEESVSENISTIAVYSKNLATSVVASIDEDLYKNMEYDSESETWSEPDRNVSAARIGLSDSGGKAVARYSRPIHPETESDLDLCRERNSKKPPEVYLQKKIQHLQKMIESLKRELRILMHTKCEDTGNNFDLKSLRNFDNKSGYALQADKYKVSSENVKRLLQNIFEYLEKSCQFSQDDCLLRNLNDLFEQFDLIEKCNKKLHKYYEEFGNRYELLSNILEETQMKFGNVMIDLHQSKLSYNELMMKYEDTVKQLQTTPSKNEITKLLNQLENLQLKIKDLERPPSPNSDELTGQLQQCKQMLEILIKDNTKSIDKLNDALKYKDLYENVNKKLMENDEENRRKFVKIIKEKDSIIEEEKIKINQLIKENHEIKELIKKSNLEMKDINGKLMEEEMKNKKITELIKTTKIELNDAKLNIEELKKEIKEKNQVIIELQKMNENYEVDKKEIKELRNLLENSKIKLESREKEKAQMEEEKEKYKNELEKEKENYENKLEKERKEHENIKLDQQSKLNNLLTEIVKYRNDEETNMKIHRQILNQIEEMKIERNSWKNMVIEWREKYEELLKEKINLEMKFNNEENGDDENLVNNHENVENKYKLLKREWLEKESQLRNQLDAASLTTSHVILEWTRLANEKLRLQRELRHRDRPQYVVHLENVKLELEERVDELECANKEMESRLCSLLVAKSTLCDNYPTSGDDSSRPNSPNKIQSASPLTISFPTTPLSSQSSSPTRNIQTAHYNMFDDVFVDKKVRSEIARDKIATSPDLGIDSDNGRLSSLEGNSEENGDMAMKTVLEDENRLLRQQLNHTRKALEETLLKLTNLNEKKKQMEKAICKQIYKTNHILKKARVNLEEGNENHDQNNEQNVD